MQILEKGTPSPLWNFSGVNPSFVQTPFGFCHLSGSPKANKPKPSHGNPTSADTAGKAELSANGSNFMQQISIAAMEVQM